jgi:hypothetical protein
MKWISSRIKLLWREEVRTGIWICFWQPVDPMIERCHSDEFLAKVKTLEQH